MLAFYLLKRERRGKNQATCEINVLIKPCEGEHIRFCSLFDVNNFNNWLRDPYTEIIKLKIQKKKSQTLLIIS